MAKRANKLDDFLTTDAAKERNKHLFGEGFIDTKGIEAKKPTEPKRGKYGNITTIYDGIKYPSMLEADRARWLDICFDEGKVKWWGRQTKFTIFGVECVVDFVVFWTSGAFTVEDTKGRETAQFKRNMKQLKVRFPELEVLILKRKDVHKVY